MGKKHCNNSRRSTCHIKEKKKKCFPIMSCGDVNENDKKINKSDNIQTIFFNIEEEKSNLSQPISLQDAFLKFHKKRQYELSLRNEEEDDQIKSFIEPTEERLLELRQKFLDQCKKYIGVPYKKKYHKPGTPEYNSNIFLDCCGLVRRVLRDLRKDIGFRIGPWNQAYMYDTLPVKISREEEMKPGDLVFISGIYFDKKMRKQPHDMVHVEVWLGEGIKTVGARWHKGHVQIFDSYQFVSTNYHSMVYHFCSIDTWLRGTCKSFCQRHPWKRKRKGSPSKKSIFYRKSSPKTSNKRNLSPTTTESLSSEQTSDETGSYMQTDEIDASEEQDQPTTSSGMTSQLSPNTLERIRENVLQESLNRADTVCDTIFPTSVNLPSLHENVAHENSTDHMKPVKFLSFSKAIAISDPAPEHAKVTNVTRLPSLNPTTQQANTQAGSTSPTQSNKSHYLFTNQRLPRDLLDFPADHHAAITSNVSKKASSVNLNLSDNETKS